MTTETNNADRRRFDETISWYVNGTASTADRNWVDGYLRSHPDAQVELGWHQTLRQHIKDLGPAMSPEIGFNRLMKKVRDDRRARAPQSQGFGDRVLAFFEGFRLTPAMAVAYAVVLAQTAVIVSMLGEKPEDDRLAFRSAAPTQSAVEEGPYLKLRFQDAARADELNALLASTGGTLVRGPDANGAYYLSIPKWKIDAAAKGLEASAVVASVEVATRLPQIAE
jgi:hypothetical protein